MAGFQSLLLSFLAIVFLFIWEIKNSLTGKKNSKVQVGKDQEKAQSEKDPHSKNRGGKKQN